MNVINNTMKIGTEADMDRINRILFNNVYKEHINAISDAEVNRVYCHHDMTHFLDVARIALIICREEDIDVDRDMIYAAALLHDIGRDVQYRDNTPHEEASAEISAGILECAGFDENEITTITCAIREHGNADIKDRCDLMGVLYRADKLSRKCFACRATDTCHKAIEKRNMYIKY